MGYTSRRGRRPNEYASKSAHGHIIKDSSVQEFLGCCNLPRRASEVAISNSSLHSYTPASENPIRYVIAVDGGYNEVAVQTEFPSATVCFFQVGALLFSVADLEGIDAQPFIDPSDMAKLNQIQRLKFTLPVRNIALKDETTLTASVRRAVYDFFRTKPDDGLLIDTLRWFVFQEYDTPVAKWVLANCPLCEQAEIPLWRDKISKENTFACERCGGEIYMTDVFRLHEAVDDELGAGGILGYVMTTFEQIVLIHLIRLFLKNKPSALGEIQFIKDGPLAFFGQTANMHKPMRTLVRFLFERHNLYLAGLEKIGPFVEHAHEVADKLADSTILLLDNDYMSSITT